MRVIISARKGHASPERFTHYMAVDEGRGFHGLPDLQRRSLQSSSAPKPRHSIFLIGSRLLCINILDWPN